MKKMLSLFLCSVFFLGADFVLAQEDANARFQAMAGGDGVVNAKNNPQTGELISFMVIGRGRIRTSLPKQKANQIARKEAERYARNAVSKFFNTSVQWKESAAEGMICTIKGNSAGDEAGSGTSQEESSTEEVSAEKSSAASQAALAGLRWLWTGTDPADGSLVMIYGWKFADVKTLVNVSKTMSKAARESVNQAKAVEGARQQDSNAAYQKEEGRDMQAQQAVAPALAPVPVQPRAGQNETQPPATSIATDAADFF